MFRSPKDGVRFGIKGRGVENGQVFVDEEVNSGVPQKCTKKEQNDQWVPKRDPVERPLGRPHGEVVERSLSCYYLPLQRTEKREVKV